MPEIERIPVTLNDLEMIASVLESALTLIEARDLEVAALRMSPPMPSALGIETKRALDRIEGLLEGHYAEIGRAAREARGEVEPEEELSAAPLGRPEVKRAREPWDFPGNAPDSDEMFRRGSEAVREDRGEA